MNDLRARLLEGIPHGKFIEKVNPDGPAAVAAIDELVECLAKAFAEPMRLAFNQTATAETAALLAQHGKVE